MEWNVNNAFKTYKEMEPKAMMDMSLLPHSDPIDIALGSSSSDNPIPNNTAPPKRKKTMTSVFLKYFETSPDTKTRKCKLCGQSYSIATATGNLGRHLNNRHPGYDKASDVATTSVPPPPQTPPAAVKPSQSNSKAPQIDYDHLNWLLLKWLSLSSLPPSTVDETWLGNSFKFLNPSVQLWPSEKYKAVLKEVFRSMQGDVKTSLEHVQSRVSLTLSFWSSYEGIFYMSVTGHWIDENWSSHRLLLDICRIPYPSGGSEIYASLLKVLKMFAVEDRVLCCTHDNSENAIHACHSLKEYLDGQKVLLPFCYIPCAAQTLNDIIDEGLATIKPIISKIREFAQELNASLELSDDFVQLTTAYQEGNWKLPVDASSRWSGNYQMVNILCKAGKSLDSVIRKNEECLENRMVLSSAEKNAVSIVHSYLDLDSFHKTTDDMCTNKDLTVGLALLFMDNISEMITTCQKSCHNPDWLRTCAENMSQKARSYNTQVCNVFTYITAVLDPRIKTEYIPETLNLASYIDEARVHFIRNYASPHFTSSLASGYRPHQEIDEGGGGNISFAEEIARRKRRGSMSNSNAVDELTQYLSESIVPMQTDVLEWWKGNSGRYPRLSNMARDFLAVQATSAAPEEIFCVKGEEIDKQKYCMPHDSTQSVLCIRSWIEGGMKLKFKSTEIDYERLMELAATVAADNSDKNQHK